MTCANCNVKLDGGYQSSENLNLCQPCADWEKQGKEPCIGCGADVCEDALCRDVGEYAEEVVRRVEADEYEDGMTDAEADADTLRSCGWGTDEDYGYFGDD